MRVARRGESGWSRTATQFPRTASGRTAQPAREPGSAPDTEATSGATRRTCGSAVGETPTATRSR